MTNTISSLDDLRVAVSNPGPVEPTWFYDGKPYTYTVRTGANKTAITVVPWKIAAHHWAIAAKTDEHGNIKIVRKDWKEQGDRDSALDSRLACICPKKWHKTDEAGHYIDDPEIKNWFLNKVTFKAKAIKQVMTEEEFISA